MLKKSSRNRWGILLAGFACLLLISPIKVTPLSLLTDELKPTFSAEMLGANPVPVETALDLNQDGKTECINLVNGGLTVYRCDNPQAHVLWQSPADWMVKQWTFSDLNDDGTPEITMLVWRDFSSWPVDKVMPAGGRIESFHDGQGKSCHVIMIGWKKGTFQEIWAGSALYAPALTLLAADIDEDGYQELITVEGKYQQAESLRSGPIAIWGWSGFGFSLQKRLEGSFRNLVLLENTQKWMIASQ